MAVRATPGEHDGRRGAAELVGLATIEATLHRLFIAAPGTKLRTEDQKKALELRGLLPEIARALGRSRGRARVIVDAAAGKSYAGLLAVHLLGLDDVRIIAIERDGVRLRAAREAAARLGASVRLETCEADLGDRAAWPESPDLVVALHACGPASDAVIDGAIACRARRVLLVPCCTGRAVAAVARARRAAARLELETPPEIRRQLVEALVAAERTARLEAAGFGVEVAAFVPPTTTPYNLLWRAVRVGEPVRMARASERLAAWLRATSPEQ